MSLKKIAKIFSIALCFLALIACSKKSSPEVENAIEVAEEAVTIANDQDFDKLETLFSKEFFEKMAMEDFQKRLESVLEKTGTLDKIEKSAGQEKDGVFVVQVVAKQSEGNFSYIISLDKDYKISGFYVK